MKNCYPLYVIILLILCLAATSQSYAQEGLKQRPSPTAIVTMKYEDIYVKITYGQPHKRNREIFGDLVPYGQVWRTGANEATEITLTGDIMIHSDTLKAGTYSIFSIPEKSSWTIIFNDNLGQWGSYNYHEKSDVLRVTVPVQSTGSVVWEPFTIAFEQRNSKADIVMKWDRTMLAIPITFIQE